MAHGLEATLAVLQKQGFYNMEVGETKHSPASDPLHHEICTPVLSPLHVAFLPAKAEQQQMKTAQFLGQRDRHISLTEVYAICRYCQRLGIAFCHILSLDSSEI